MPRRKNLDKPPKRRKYTPRQRTTMSDHQEDFEGVCAIASSKKTHWTLVYSETRVIDGRLWIPVAALFT